MTAGVDAVVAAQVVAAVEYSSDEDLKVPGYQPYAAHSPSDRSDAGCKHAEPIDWHAVAL